MRREELTHKKSPFQGMFLLRRLIEIFCLSETDALAFLGLDKVFLGLQGLKTDFFRIMDSIGFK